MKKNYPRCGGDTCADGRAFFHIQRLFKQKDGGDETTTMPPEAVEAVQTLKLPYSKGDKLNPFTATSMLNQQLMPLIYDGLFALDKNYNPQPLLA